MKLVIPKTFKWSSFGLLKASKLVIVRSLFCNFLMNTKPGKTGNGGGVMLVVVVVTAFVRTAVVIVVGAL